MDNVFSAYDRADVTLRPFPFLSDKKLYQQSNLVHRLSKEFPPDDCFFSVGGDTLLSNHRYDISPTELFRNENISSLWKEFIQSFVDHSFWNSFLALFRESIETQYPHLEIEANKPLDEWKTGMAGTVQPDEVDILLNANVSINSPVRKPSVVNHGAAHIDSSDKLFGGLMYFRHPEDDSTGGDLELFMARGDTPLFAGKRVIKNSVRCFDRVPYDNGSFIWFLNDVNSIHGVSRRSKAKISRRFIYFSGVLTKSRVGCSLNSLQKENNKGVNVFKKISPSLSERLRRIKREREGW